MGRRSDENQPCLSEQGRRPPVCYHRVEANPWWLDPHSCGFSLLRLVSSKVDSVCHSRLSFEDCTIRCDDCRHHGQQSFCALCTASCFTVNLTTSVRGSDLRLRHFPSL